MEVLTLCDCDNITNFYVAIVSKKKSQSHSEKIAQCERALKRTNSSWRHLIHIPTSWFYLEWQFSQPLMFLTTPHPHAHICSHQSLQPSLHPKASWHFLLQLRFIVWFVWRNINTKKYNFLFLCQYNLEKAYLASIPSIDHSLSLFTSTNGSIEKASA